MTLATATKPKTELINKNAFYNKLSKTDAEWAKSKAIEFKKSADRAVAEWEAQGNILIEAKERLGHGNFTEFVETEFTPIYGVTIDTAERLMKAAKLLKERPKLGGYRYTLLAELSKAPDPIIQEAEERANTEAPMTVREVQQKRQEQQPKPKYQKGQFVESPEQVIAVIETAYSKDLTYKLKRLHGASIKEKRPESKLTLCPVQERQNHYDDCYRKPKEGEKVILAPIASWRQHLKDEVVTVIGEVPGNNGIFVKGDNDNFVKPIAVEWAELKPYEPEIAEDAIVDVEASKVEEVTVSQPQPIQSEEQDTDVDNAVAVVNNNLTKLEPTQLNFLLSSLAFELGKRTYKQTVSQQLDDLIDQIWEKDIKPLPQLQREKFLIRLIDKVFG